MVRWGVLMLERGVFCLSFLRLSGDRVSHSTQEEYADSVSTQTNSLYDPLENLESMLGTFLGKVEAWANKPK